MEGERQNKEGRAQVGDLGRGVGGGCMVSRGVNFLVVVRNWEMGGGGRCGKER